MGNRKMLRLNSAWLKSIELLRKKDFEGAYRNILQEGDDVYLLRLVAQTGPVIKFLSDQTASMVLLRINKIMRSGSLQALVVDWVDEAGKTGILQKLDRHQQNEYMDTLYHFTK